MTHRIDSTIDSTQLQRLVDGECSSKDIRSLLTTARNYPEYWETIAVALLEDRAWQQQLGGSSQAAETLDCLADTQEMVRQNVAVNPRELDSTQGMLSPARQNAFDQASVSKGVQRREFPSLFHGLMMAASLLIVALLSYTTGRQWTNQGQLAQSTSPHSMQAERGPLMDLREGSALIAHHALPNHSPSASPQASPQITPVSLNQPDYRMQLPNHDPSQVHGDVPLYLVRSLDQWQQIDQRLPKEFHLTPDQLNELSANGIRVRQELDFLSGNLDDGRVFMVPIRSVRLVHPQ